MRNDHVEGIGSIGSGTYEDITFEGVGKTYGNIKAKNISSEGTYKNIGVIECESLKIEGFSRILGDVKAGTISCEGLMKIRNCDVFASIFKCEGFVSSNKEIIADTFNLNGFATIFKLCGSNIYIKADDKNIDINFPKAAEKFGSMYLGRKINNKKNIIDYIECDNITAENLETKVIKAIDVNIFDSTVDYIEYSGELNINNCIVKKHVKVEGNNKSKTSDSVYNDYTSNDINDDNTNNSNTVNNNFNNSQNINSNTNNGFVNNNTVNEIITIPLLIDSFIKNTNSIDEIEAMYNRIVSDYDIIFAKEKNRDFNGNEIIKVYKDGTPISIDDKILDNITLIIDEKISIKGNLKTHRSVECLNIGGYINCGGSVECLNVNNFINANASVECEDVGGYINTGGGLICNNINSYINAGANVVCKNIDGHVYSGGKISTTGVQGNCVSGFGENIYVDDYNLDDDNQVI